MYYPFNPPWYNNLPMMYGNSNPNIHHPLLEKQFEMTQKLLEQHQQETRKLTQQLEIMEKEKETDALNDQKQFFIEQLNSLLLIWVKIDLFIIKIYIQLNRNLNEFVLFF